MYKPLMPYEGLNDTGVMWGIKYFNDILSSAGPHGHLQIYFNGDYCVMPPPDVYPWLPSASSKLSFSEAIWIIAILEELFL
ncbi:hypothetical protein P8452_51925 [Trifolium repens]|nr:hypothetical protein P8452_51925 [Trifolium repens]